MPPTPSLSAARLLAKQVFDAASLSIVAPPSTATASTFTSPDISTLRSSAAAAAAAAAVAPYPVDFVSASRVALTIYAGLVLFTFYALIRHPRRLGILTRSSAPVKPPLLSPPSSTDSSSPPPTPPPSPPLNPTAAPVPTRASPRPPSRPCALLLPMPDSPISALSPPRTPPPPARPLRAPGPEAADLAELVASYLGRICRRNDVELPPRPELVELAAHERPFYSAAARGERGIALREYVRNVVDAFVFLEEPYVPFLAALVYMERAHRRSRGLCTNSYNVHRLYIVSVTLSCKNYCDEAPTSAKFYARAGGLAGAAELRELERLMLAVLDFRLDVPLETFQLFESAVLNPTLYY